MGFTQVQKPTYGSSANATNHSFTVTEPTAGNLLVLCVNSNQTITTPSGWTSRVGVAHDGFTEIEIFDRTAPASFGTSMAFDLGASGAAAATFFEYSSDAGTIAADQIGSTGTDNGGTGTTGTTTKADELAIGCVGDTGQGFGGAHFSAWSNSFTEEADVGSSAGTQVDLGVASRVLTATGTYSTTPTGSSNSGCIATYLEVADGTISHAASTQRGATQAAGDFNFDHAGGTDLSAVVAVICQTGNGDDINGVTYGGEAMTRRAYIERTTTETGAVYIYTLADGDGQTVLDGTQNLAVDCVAAILEHWAVVSTCKVIGGTAQYDSEVSDDLGVVANPTTTHTFTGTLGSWVGYAGHFYGGAAPVSTGLQTGETYLFGRDAGVESYMTYRRAPGTSDGSTTWGYTTLASDDQVIAAVVLKGVASGGGTDYTETPSDTEGLTDSHALDQGKSHADTLGLTDARVFDQDKTLPVNILGLTDALAALFERPTTDTLGLTDTAATVLGREVGLADTLGLTDEIQTEQSKSAAPTDTLGLTDTLATQGAFLRDLTDTVTLTDAVIISGDRALAQLDTLGLTDMASTAGVFQRAAADTLDLSDSLVADVGKLITQADTLSLADARTLDQGKGHAETITLADALIFELSKVLADTAAITDILATAGMYERTLADTLSLTDLQSSDAGLVYNHLSAATGSPRYTATPTAGHHSAIPVNPRYRVED